MSGTDWTRTPNLSLYKPIYDMDTDAWGTHLNANSDILDAALGPGGSVGSLYLPIAGGTLTGALGGTQATFSGPVTLSGAPTAALQAATKAYVDSAVAAAGGAINTNYADNAGFAINQRAYVSGTALAAAAFGHDRWKGGASGCTYTFTATPPSTTITITAGSLQQVVEGVSLVAGTYVLSWTGTSQGRIASGSYAASPITAPITAGTNTTIEFNVGTLSQVKFERSASPTPWSARNARDDLANCQRFYETGQFTMGGAASNGITVWQCQTYSAPKRIAAVTLTTSGTSVTALTGAALNGQGAGAFQVSGTTNSTGQYIYSGFYQASADL